MKNNQTVSKKQGEQGNLQRKIRKGVAGVQRITEATVGRINKKRQRRINK